MGKILKTLFITMVIWLIAFGIASASEVGKQPFTDIPADSSNAAYLQYLNNKGVMNGYPDGSFHPSSGLTRAEAAVVICKATNTVPDYKQAVYFQDVKNNYWAYSYIAAAVKAGYLRGNPDKTFLPENTLTRAEGITLLFRISKADLSSAILPPLTDMNNKHWAAQSVAAGLAAGMVSLNKDGKRFMPDAPFTRINLAEALGIMLTHDPSLYSADLNGSLKPLEGTVTIKKAHASIEEKVIQETRLEPGDFITVTSGKSEISYPDGSSILLKGGSQITIKESRGRKYIKADGMEGIAVDWLNLDMKKGTILTALATQHTANAAPEDNKTGKIPTILGSLASTNYDSGLLGALANSTSVQQPWYVASQTKKVKVQVDMPWGVCAVRGTFVLISVGETGHSQVSCLTGSADVTNGGVTVPLTQNQATQVTGEQSPPPSPTPISSEVVQQFAQEQQWVEQTAHIMDQLQEVIAPPPSLPVINPQEDSASVESIAEHTVQPSSTVTIIANALSAIGIIPASGPSTPTNTTTTSRERHYSTPLSSNTAIASSVYNVTAAAISDVDLGTSKADFLANLVKGEVYQNWNSDGIHDPVTSADTLVVTAEDGTQATYTVTVNSTLSSNTTITSGSYSVIGNSISSVPDGTSKTDFLVGLVQGEVHQNWNSDGIHDPVTSGDTLVVTAQDGTQVSYLIEIIPSIPAPGAPSLNSAVTNSYGTKVILTFSKDMMATPLVAPAGFAVTIDETDNLVTGVTRTNTKTLELTLTTAVGFDQSVKVSYTPGGIISADGGILAVFADQVVTNNVPSGTITWKGGDGLWSTASNWDLNRVPSTDDHVIIKSGTVTFSAGASDIARINCASTLVINGGTFYINDTNNPSNIEDLTLSYGTLGGSGNVTITGTGNWSGGTMSGIGTTIVQSGATVNIGPGNNRKYLSRALENNGTINCTSKEFYYSGTGITINNNGVFDFQGDYDFTSYGGGSLICNNNVGAILKKSAGTGGASIPVAINNAGTISIDANCGEFYFSGGVNNSGSIVLDNATTLYLGTRIVNLDPGTSVTGPGTLVVMGYTNFNGPFEGLFLNNLNISGTANCNIPVKVANFTLSGGTLGGSGNLTITGTGNWLRGTMSGTGTTIVQSGATLNISPGNFKNLSRTLENNGIINCTGSGFYYSGTGATINNNGVFDFQGDYSLSKLNVSAIFNNNTGAILKKSAGTGGATITAAVNNNGSVLVGTNGSIKVNTYTQGNTGTLQFNVTSVTQGSGYNQLQVTGQAILAGTLDLNLVSPYVPSSGDSYTPLTYGSYSGTFNTITNNQSATFTTTYNSGNLVLVKN